MTKRFNRLIAVGLLMVGCLVALFCLALQRKAPSFRLDDESIVTLERVSVQQPTRFPWLRTAREWVARKLGRPIFSSFAAENSFVLWLSRHSKADGAYMDFDWLSHIVAVDEHGCEFDSSALVVVHTDTMTRGSRPPPKAPAGSKYIVASTWLPVFPRREKTFQVRFYDQNKTLAGSLHVQNPSYRRYPNWEPDTLPVSRSVGELMCTFVSVSNRWTIRRYGGLTPNRFLLTPEIELPEHWELTEISVEDATGNQSNLDPMPRLLLQSRKLLGARRSEPVTVEFKLCTNESAWGLKATLFRTPQARFASNEIWTIPKLPLPGPGITTVLAGSNTWQNTKVKLCAVSGQGTFTYSNGVPISVSGTVGSGGGSSGRNVGGVLVSEITTSAQKPQLLLKISDLNPTWLFQAIAQVNGQNYLCRNASSSGEYKLFQFEVPSGTTAVDLVLVIQRPTELTFFVPPKPPSTK